MQLKWGEIVRLKLKMRKWKSNRRMEEKDGESRERNSDSSWSGISSEDSATSNLLVQFRLQFCILQNETRESYEI